MSDAEKACSQAKMDQMTAMIADAFPLLWRRLFDECVKANFSEDQSFKLVQTYILSMGAGGTNLPTS